MHDALKKLDETKARKILDIVNPHLNGGAMDIDNTNVLAQEMSFYPGYQFIELAQFSSHPPRKIHALVKKADNDNGPTILDWTNTPIYEVNARAPVTLTEKNIRDYVRFFFSHVRGRHGRFIITETVDDIKWQEEPPPAARKAVAKMIQPVRIMGMADDGTFQLQVCMMFKDSLFKSRVNVTPGGEVEITDEELIIEDMPVYDDTLGQ